jgi:hypothetical protein
MPRTTIDLTDYALHMPNGEVLSIVSGELPVTYTVQRAEPDVGIFSPWPEWDVDAKALSVAAWDADEREVRLSLPMRHPAVQSLLKAASEVVEEACMEDDRDEGERDYGRWEDEQERRWEDRRNAA